MPAGRRWRGVIVALREWHKTPKRFFASEFLCSICLSGTFRSRQAPSLFQNDPIPIHQRLEVEERDLTFGRVPDEGTVVIIFGSIVQVPAQGITKDTQAGGAGEVVGQGGLEGVDVGAVGRVGNFDHGRFMDPAQPLVLRDFFFWASTVVRERVKPPDWYIHGAETGAALLLPLDPVGASPTPFESCAGLGICHGLGWLLT